MTTPSATKPPVPTPVTIVAVLLTVAILVFAYWIGTRLGAPEPEASPEPVAPLAAPARLGEFQQTGITDPSPAPWTDGEFVTADYTNGEQQIVLVLARPVEDLETFLTNAGIKDLQARPNTSAVTGATTMCGTSADTGFSACGTVVETEGRLVVGATAVSHDHLVGLLDLLAG